MEFLEKIRDIEYLNKYRAEIEQYNSKYIPTGPEKLKYEKQYLLNCTVDPEIIPYKKLYDEYYITHSTAYIDSELDINIKSEILNTMSRLKMEMSFYSILSKAKLYYENRLPGDDNLNEKCFNI
jgi:hypothetical protein